MSPTTGPGGPTSAGQPDAAERWALAWAGDLRRQVGHVRNDQPAVALNLTRRCVRDLLAALTGRSLDQQAVRRAAEALVAAQFTDEPLPVSLDVYRRHAPLAAPGVPPERIGAVERAFVRAYIRAVRTAAAAGPETSHRATSLTVAAARGQAEDLRRLLDAVFTQVPAPLAVVPSDGLVARVNHAFTELTGRSAQEWTTLKVNDGMDSRDAMRLWADFRHVAAEPRGEARRRVRYLHPDGRTIPAEVTLTHLPETGNYPGYVLLHAANHSDQALVRHVLHERDVTDPETSLLSRPAFFQQLAHACQDPIPGQTLFCIRINDLHRAEQLGETACQNIVLSIADQLQEALGSRSETIGRLGRDTVAVLVPTRGRADQRHVANDFHDAVRDGPLRARQPLQLTAGIGIAEYTPDATPDTLMTAANDAARRAATAGHPRTITAGSSAEGPPDLASYLTPDAHLRLHCEPVHDLATGHTTGLLIAPARPEHDGQPLTIHRFLHPALTTTDWLQIRRRFFTTACTRLHEHNTTAGGHLTLGLSLTAGQPPDPAVVADITAALTDSRLPAHRLHLHVTQNDIHQSPETLTTSLTTLHHQGIRLILTGLGADPTDYAILQAIPWHGITIDPRALPAELTHTPDPEPEPQLAIRLVLHAATLLGIPATADYIETPHQAELLHHLGCLHAWGPYTHNP